MINFKFPQLKDWQNDVFVDIQKGVSDIYVVKAKRQVGKSVLSVCALLYFAFTQSKSISICIEPTLSQSRRVYKQLINSIGGEDSPAIKSANATLLSIEFINGSEITFKSAEQKEALRGMTVKRGILIIDEAAFITDDIFEIIYPVVDATKAPVLMVSTPLFQSGEFYKKYIEGLGGGVCKSYDWSTYDTSCFLAPEKLEYYRQTVSPLKFLSEYLGQFITEGSYVFGDLEKAITEWSSKPSVYGGIDWAASTSDKSDETTMTLMDEDGAVTEILSYRGLSPTEQVEKIAEDINKRGLKCVQVEVNSIGEVYCDMLKRKVTCFISEFWTSNESKRRIVEQLISGIQSGQVRVPREPILMKQMQHFEIQKTKTGYTYNNDSNTIHDDRVISLAFCYDVYMNNIGSFSISFV